MADLSPSPSFIPKQNPNKFARRASSRQVYVLTLISYTLLIATLLAVAGAYLYGRYTERSLAQEITGYNAKIASFNQAALDEVIEADEHLRHTRRLIDETVSIPAALAVLEVATVDTVQFTDLSFTQEDSGDLVLEAAILTDSFDSVLFQRQMYEAAEDIAAVTLEDVTIQFALAGGESGGVAGQTAVSFSARFSIDPDQVLVPQATTTLPSGPAGFVGPTSTVPVPLPAPTTTATVTPTL